MDLELLRVFIEVANQNSFTKTAKSLQLSSTNVSAKVQKLEEQLSIRLFDRTTRAVHLTEVGEMIYQKAVDILDISDEIVDIAASQIEEPQGLLRICAMATMGSMVLGDWLIEFQLLYPKVSFEMIYSNEPLDLQEHHLDFGFRQNCLPSSNLIARKLVEQGWGVFASPDFIANAQPIKHPEDLHQVSCIGVMADNNDAAWRFQRNKQEIQFHPKRVLTLEDPVIIHKAALAGIGVAFLPNFLTHEDVKEGWLVELLPDWSTPPSAFYIIYTSKKHMSAKNRHFIDFILEKFPTRKALSEEFLRKIRPT